MNIGSLLEHCARYRPDDLAVVCGGTRVTHAEHAAQVHRVARVLLRLGMKPGDRLALVLGNSLEILEIYRAAALLGIVVVPLSPLLLAPALVSLLRDSGSVALIADATTATLVEDARQQLSELPESRCLLVDVPGTPSSRDWHSLADAESSTCPDVPEVQADDSYNIFYSSGTTGLPKGIVHTHRIRALYALLFAHRFDIDATSVVMHGGSLVFNGAFPTLMPAWLVGCPYVLLPRFDPAEWISTVQQEGVTHAMVVPSQLVSLLHAPGFTAASLASLRMLCSVGAPLPRPVKEQLLEVLPEGALWELYGLTEGFITVLDGRDFRAHMDSVGTPVAFNDMRIVDEEGRDALPGTVGEILGRGPLLTPGYWGRDDLTAEAIIDGWLHTGDVGFVDDAGYLHLVDRHRDLIISGGVNVFPRDIEEVAARHPAVQEVAVYGVPDDRWGETPIAAIVLVAGSDANAGDICDWINANVGARFQRVRAVEIIDEMPRNIAGKTLKRVLREQHRKS